MAEDIRDKKFVTHEDVIKLNFIKAASPYVFRRHHRQGLRSHILEVLRSGDVECERTGTVVDGIRWFPKAKPVGMFRIFRTRLKTLDNALSEIRRVKIVERFLAPKFLAKSSEFIVDYLGSDGWEPLLCGFQTYEKGEIVDPWTLLDRQTFGAALFEALKSSIRDPDITPAPWRSMVRSKTAAFIDCVKDMIRQTGYVPDLAGIGNLVIMPTGEIKLVDINNISKVCFHSEIPLDDRGYPVGDKSIEALYLLEKKLAGRSAPEEDPLYRTFLHPERKNAVRGYEVEFYRKRRHINGYPALRQ